MSNLIQSFKRFLAPGIDKNNNAEIKILARQDGSFKVDINSFRKSKVVQEQIASLRKLEKEQA